MNNTSEPDFFSLKKKMCPNYQCLQATFLVFFCALGAYVFFNWLPYLINKNDFQVISANSYSQNKNIFIDADLQMNFPTPVAEALENGIPLTIAVEAQVFRKRTWWRDIIIKKSTLLFELRYHPLTNVHEVKNIASNERYSFDSYQAAMNALGTIRGAQILQNNQLLGNYQYFIQMRLLLDISHLPPALRQVASLSSSWRIESHWYQWKIDNNNKMLKQLSKIKNIGLDALFIKQSPLLTPLLTPLPDNGSHNHSMSH